MKAWPNQTLQPDIEIEGQAEAPGAAHAVQGNNVHLEGIELQLELAPVGYGPLFVRSGLDGFAYLLWQAKKQ